MCEITYEDENKFLCKLTICVFIGTKYEAYWANLHTIYDLPACDLICNENRETYWVNILDEHIRYGNLNETSSSSFSF